MRQVITYLRFSSKPQERGDSIRRQQELFASWLQSIQMQKLSMNSWMKANRLTMAHLKGDFGRMLQNIQDGNYPSGHTVLEQLPGRLSL